MPVQYLTPFFTCTFSWQSQLHFSPVSSFFFFLLLLKDTDHSNRLQGERRFASYHLKENLGQCKQVGGQTSHNLSGWSKKKSLSLVSRFNLRKLRHTLAHKHNPCVNRFHPRTLHTVGCAINITKLSFGL